jgi:hypothetical protein
MTSVVGGIDQGSHLPCPQVVNLDDCPSNDQAFDIVSPRTKAHDLLGIRGKPNKKIISKKRHLSRESPPIAKLIKEYS